MAAKKNEPAIKRYAIVVSGRVQGVGFRFFTRERATFRSLSGWVRNLYNGDVEAEAQGSEENLESFLQELWDGPLFGRVRDVKHREIPPLKDDTGFVVRL